MSGYIGNIPTPQATQTRDLFTATSGQTSFATSGYTPNFLDVFLNGVHLVSGTDYTATNGSDVVLASGATAGDSLEVVAYTTFQTGDFVPTSGGTFSGNVAVTGNLTVDTNTLFVDATNNRVGVGTSSPATKLDITVDGAVGLNVNRTTSSGPTVRVQVVGNDVATLGSSTDGQGSFDIAAAASVYLRSTGATNFIKFDTNGSERARIDASGNLLVGTTSVLSSGKTNVLFNGQTQIGMSLQTTFGSVGSDFIRFLDSSGTKIGEIEQNGASSVSYTTSSDYRLKEDVQPMVGASDRLMALKPVNFAWKVDGSRVDGFLAHEAQEVVPEAVTGQKDAVDDEGNPQYQGIDQSKIVPLLTAALQEAMTKIATLEADVAALKGASA